MYKIINHPDVPELLRTPILVDEKLHIPRYWASIYSLIFFSNLSHATQSRIFGSGSLDLAKVIFLLQNNQGDGYKSNNMGLKWQILYDFIYKI